MKNDEGGRLRLIIQPSYFIHAPGLVVIELKKPGVPARAAFDGNLTHTNNESTPHPNPSPVRGGEGEC